jgi:protocatechuate 3,4-dioxygenase beta subunit
MSGYRPDVPGTQPPYLHADYKSTTLRAPSQPLIPITHTLSEITGPIFGASDLSPADADLTSQHAREPIGEPITV